MTTVDILAIISASFLLIGTVTGILSGYFTYHKNKYFLPKQYKTRRILTLVSGFSIFIMFGLLAVGLGIENVKNETSEWYWSLIFFVLFGSITLTIMTTAFRSQKENAKI